MAASGGVKAWKEMLVRNAVVPVAWDRQQEAADISEPFCLTFSTVEGLFHKVDHVSGYQLRVSLYDARYKQFFGRTWAGPVVQARIVGQKMRLNYNQNVYFHTSFGDAAVIVVVEIVAVSQVDREQQEVSCGWGLFRLYGQETEVQDMAAGRAPPTQRMDIYHGSPRALLFLDEPLEGNSAVTLLDGCQVLYTLQTHRHLRRAMHLIPEHTLVGTNDVMPGLVEAPRDPRNPGAPPDNLRKPRVLRSAQIHLEKIVVNLTPSLEKMEDDLCRQLNEDRLNRQNAGGDGTDVVVMERRLSVGIHNGWTYVQEPVTVYLNMDTEGGGMKRSSSMRRGSTFMGHRRTPSTGSLPGAGSGSLVYRSRVTLDGLAEDPLFTVVFLLEYVLGQPVRDKDKKASMATSSTFPVAVRWAAWNPFASSSTDHTVQLMGGPGFNADLVFLFRSPMADAVGSTENMRSPTGGAISFSFSSVKKGKENRAVAGGITSLAVPDVGLTRSALTQSHDSLATDDSHGVLHAVQLPGKPPLPSSRSVGHLEAAPHVPPSAPPGMSGMYPGSMGYPMHGYPLGYPMSHHPGGVYGMGMGPGISPVPGQAPRGVIPVEIQHVRDSDDDDDDEYSDSGKMAPGGIPNPDLQELPFTPVHAPIMAVAPGMTAGQGLSRAAYAQLYSAGFPPVVDRHGEAPDVVDPADPFTFVHAKEEVDALKTNEVILQFLAYSRFLTFTEQAGDGGNQKPGTIFLTFQFYRFPQVTTERLLLGAVQGGLSADPNSLPCVLHRLDKDGAIVKEPAGYQVKYNVDPSYLKPGEGRLFVQHLSQQTLHIDVWDGDSLLLIGSSAVDLKHLCRQGHEAVQVTYELDVVSTEYVEQEGPVVPSGDITQTGAVHPVDVHSVIKGRLHMRLANVGHPADPQLMKSGGVSSTSKPVVVVKGEINSNSQFLGGSLNALTSHYNALRQSAKVYKAAHMAESNQELAAVLHSRQHSATVKPEKPTKQASAARQRKLARMNTIRQTEGTEDPSVITSFRREKDDRARDLKTIDLYRQQEKRSGILNMLSQAISTDHTVHPAFGSTEFFEFVLKNPYNTPHTIRVECDDQELSVVTDPREWRYYKMACEIYTSVEEGMFNTETKSGCPEIFLRPKETVNVPFKFVTFKADHSVQPQAPSNPFKPPSKQQIWDKKKTSSSDSRVVKVLFRTEENKPVAILVLRVEPQPHIIDQTFRFHHPEQTFLKKSIRLPPLHTLPGMPVGGALAQVFVKCSDPNVITESRLVQQGEPHDIFLKVACGASPQVKRFFVAIYTDQFLWRPIQVWQVYVHALQRLDVSCQEGQTSRFTLVLRGTQASRLVQVFPSHVGEMEVHPRDAFMLAANAVTEIHVGVRPLSVGTRFLYLNVVDIELHQLVRTWLVCVTCHAPIISKAYELQVPIGGGKGCNKRIAYTNPYPRRKLFQLRCNRGDLLQFKDSRLEIAAGETVNIGLRFAPAHTQGTVEILVFINDEDDKNEETFCVRVSYM